MARQGSRLKGQAQVHEKDSFDYTAPRSRVQGAVSAPRTRGAGRSADAEAMLQFTEQFQRTQSSAANLFAQRASDLKEEGATEALKGSDRPAEASDAFLEGFETQQGEASVADYIADREALQLNAHQLSPEEYEAQSEEINKKYLLGAPDNFIRGFVPMALKAGKKYDIEYQKIQKTLIDQEYLQSVKKKAYSYAKVVMEDDKVTDKAKAIRGLLSAQQEHGKRMLKADRNTINKAFVETLIEEAVRGANPSLLAFTTVEDESGYSLLQDPAMAAEVNNGINLAMSKRTQLDNKAIADAEKARTEAITGGYRVAVNALFDGDVAKAENAIGMLKNVLPPADIWKIRKEFLDMQDGNAGKFAQVTNQTLFDNLKIQAKFGNLQIDEMVDFRDGLNQKDYRQIVNDIVSRKEKAIADSKKTPATKKSPAELMIDMQRTAGLETSKTKGAYGALLNPHGAARRGGFFQLRYDELIDSLEQEFKAKSKIPKDQILWAQQKAAWMAYQDVPPGTGEKVPPDPDVKNQPDTTLQEATDATPPEEDSFWQ